MFGLGAGVTGAHAYPSVYSSKKTSRKNSNPSPLQHPTTLLPLETFEAAIDGPPSPEQLRAYTEQMKRSSIFGNNSSTHTFSSSTSSSHSHDSSFGSSENLSLRRKSSVRSNTSSMRRDRPESVRIFGRNIFSRTGRKLRRETGSLGSSTSSLLLGVQEEGSAKERYFGKEASRPRTSMNNSPPLSYKSRKNTISGPYNFQHVTHTRQEHIPNLERTTPMELVSEFSAIRASQAPSNGDLKGIQARDLHFENFSSVGLGITAEQVPTPPSSPSRFRKSVTPPRRPAYSQSHDNLRTAPPRPPRSPQSPLSPISPLSPLCPIVPPARTSSRTFSTTLDQFRPLATTSLERPKTNGGFRRPSAFGPPTPPPTHLPPPPKWREEDISHAVTTPGEEAWPLTGPLGGSFNVDLADVPEEDELAARRRSRMSTTSSELRHSQSVPGLRLRSLAQASEGPETGMSNTLVRAPSKGKGPCPKSTLANDSWEDDIDYCYEHEAEADCDYEWDRLSVDDGTVVEQPSTPVKSEEPVELDEPVESDEPVLDLHLEDDRTAYRGRFRPSLLVPSVYDDLPQLSPMSGISSASSDPRTPHLPFPHTPTHFLRPSHLRSPSHASSFKESHGFNLSPSLLIPSDFSTEMERDALFDSYHEEHDTSSADIFPIDSYSHRPSSPVDEATSSTASYRSSNFSRGSARSSSTTRTSQDSVFLMSKSGLSFGSVSSLPDLVPSSLRKRDLATAASFEDLASTVAVLKVDDDDSTICEAPGLATTFQHRRNKALLEGPRKGLNHFAPPGPPPSMPLANPARNALLSPVAESFSDSPRVLEFKLRVNSGIKSPVEATHERKVSAPVEGSPVVREFKGRARASTLATPPLSRANLVGGKKRGSYMLFPQM